MNTAFYGLNLSVLLLATAPAFALATPLKVQPVGGASQQVIMCPQCGTPIACAKAGDVTLAFTADLQDPAILGYVRVMVRVTDKAGKPVDDAKVKVALRMTEHWHELTPPLTVDSQGNGLYAATTGRLGTPGTWYAELRVTTPKGDTVTQRFSFLQPNLRKADGQPAKDEKPEQRQ
jgi:hypothetical protein